MEAQPLPSILAPAQRHLWQPLEPSIWSLDGSQIHQDPTLSILRTLFDQPRWLEAHNLYDEKGCQLFEKICELPEYYATRTENSILKREAKRVFALAPVECIVELGAGFS